MKFDLVDKVIEQSDDRIVAVKTLTKAEEYLQDHFPTYPVMPGVLMLETLVQAARRLVAAKTGQPRFVLGEVRALRYGSFVRPGEALKVEVTVAPGTAPGEFKCRGVGYVLRPGETSGLVMDDEGAPTAVSGRFTLRPPRVGGP